MNIFLQANPDASFIEKIVLEMITSIIGLIPKLIGAIVVLIVGYIIAKIVATVIRKVLSNIGIDKLKDMLDKIELVQKANITVLPSEVISKIIYYTLLLFFLLIATSVLNIPEISQLVQDLITLVPELVVAFIILVIGVLVGDSIKNIVHTACKSVGIPGANIIAGFTFFFVLINALMIALRKAKIPTEFLTNNLTVAFAGIAMAFAIGYGLASKKTMANYLASFAIKDKYDLGTVITVDGHTGEIIEVDNASITLLSSEDASRIVIPLSTLTDTNVQIHDS